MKRKGKNQNKNQRIAKIAIEIARLERELKEQGKNGKDAMDKIQNITDTLSLEDMLAVDNYITEKKLLTS